MRLQTGKDANLHLNESMLGKKERQVLNYSLFNNPRQAVMSKVVPGLTGTTFSFGK